MQYTDEAYAKMTEDLFVRFPSFQKAGSEAYKPGTDHVVFFDQLLGHPHRSFRKIHVAGTNGKGSVSNMLASVLAASGLRTGLYTSPHILDFRERMRILDGRRPETAVRYISKDEVCDFISQWNSTFDHLKMSFFEITTMMAFDWFAKQEIDVAVIETGLGGRLDTTNIITPDLSVITNIGLDHCDMLGSTLPEIAFEKAGIIKPFVPAVVGESDPQTNEVFERKVLYSNLSEAEFMGDRKRIMSLLTFADRTVPSHWEKKDAILAAMDLQGSYQEKNLRTVLTAMDVLSSSGNALAPALASLSPENAVSALVHTASRMEFHGRWEKLSDQPFTIADIGHNAHGLKYNFAQLEEMKASGKCTHLIIVYGIVADKEVEPIFAMMPQDAEYIFTNASGKRALPAAGLLQKYRDFCAAHGRDSSHAVLGGTVAEACLEAKARAAAIVAEDSMALPLIYIGGSTFVVSESVQALQ